MIYSSTRDGLKIEFDHGTMLTIERYGTYPTSGLASITLRDRHGTYITDRELRGIAEEPDTAWGQRHEFIVVSNPSNITTAIILARGYDEHGA